MTLSIGEQLNKTYQRLEAKRCGKKKRKLHPYQAAAIHYATLLKVKIDAQWFRFFKFTALPDIMPKVVTFVADYPNKKDKTRLIYWAHRYLLERQSGSYTE